MQGMALTEAVLPAISTLLVRGRRPKHDRGTDRRIGRHRPCSRRVPPALPRSVAPCNSPTHDHVRFDRLARPFQVRARMLHVQTDRVDLVALGLG